jgi:hypothetical protein
MHFKYFSCILFCMCAEFSDVYKLNTNAQGAKNVVLHILEHWFNFLTERLDILSKCL